MAKSPNGYFDHSKHNGLAGDTDPKSTAIFLFAMRSKYISENFDSATEARTRASAYLPVDYRETEKDTQKE